MRIPMHRDMAKWVMIIGVSITIALFILLLSLGLAGKLTTTITTTVTTSSSITAVGPVVTQLRTVKGFQSIVANGPYIVAIVSEGNNESVEISAQSDIMSSIETLVKFQILYIRYKENVITQKPTTITLNISPISPLQKIEASGACQIKVTPVVVNDTVILEAHGASQIQASAVSSTLQLTASGASVIQVSGNATTIWMNAKGASEIRADNEQHIAPLTADTVNLDISGASDVLGKYLQVRVIKGKVAGASSVCYSGSPELKLEIMEASSVKPCKAS